jgi:hypothetical protein
VGVHVVGELALIERVSSLDCLGEDLHRPIAVDDWARKVCCAPLETLSFQTREQVESSNCSLAARFYPEVCPVNAPAHSENADEAVVQHVNNVVGQSLDVRAAHVPYLFSMAR